MAQGPLPADDGGLVAAFRAGRGAAFELIVERHYAGMLRVAEQRCGSGSLADDAVQTALVRAHRYLRGPGRVENLGAWLRRVVFNCATDLLRSEKPGAELTEEVPAAESEGVEGKELRLILEEAILRLPEVYREPLAMRYLHGLEAREIAEQLKDNLHSVKSRIARGRAELRRRIEGVLRRSGYLQG
ncbi:MAG: RNA polymerase sigma factor [Planctomycetota bacterium]